MWNDARVGFGIEPIDHSGQRCSLGSGYGLDCRRRIDYCSGRNNDHRNTLHHDWIAHRNHYAAAVTATSCSKEGAPQLEGAPS